MIASSDIKTCRVKEGQMKHKVCHEEVQYFLLLPPETDTLTFYLFRVYSK